MFEAEALWPLGQKHEVRATVTEPLDEEIDCRRRADRTVSLAAAGCLSRAAQVVTSHGVAPSTRHAANKLREMLCTRPSATAPDRQWVDDYRSQASPVSPSAIRKVVQGLPRQGAADMAGWHAEPFQLLLADRDAHAAFVKVIQ